MPFIPSPLVNLLANELNRKEISIFRLNKIFRLNVLKEKLVNSYNVIPMLATVVGWLLSIIILFFSKLF